MPNRLANATSPYLLQHKDNPVDWWEWGEDAFATARERKVPVLLSVGYAACHWCHVMAHESFEDEATAAYMNEHFVNIKVDREERPDVDAVYMSATQAMTGHGGWPMTCILDHDGNPFFAGTYFPDEPRHGSASFRQVLQALVDAWTNRADDVRRAAAEIGDHLRVQGTLESGLITAETLDGAVRTLASEFDGQHAGFGGAPKFPPGMVLEFLLRHAVGVSRGSLALAPQPTSSAATARRMVDATCVAMARGGIYDQIGGGFARYSVDAGWVVPHFEKMLYDNAQLVGLYARVGADRVARETAAFMLRELRTPEGGFASALDADSEGVEGKFYAWTPAQLVEALGAEDGAWAAETFTVTERGTFEHGSSTLQLLEDPDDLARLESVKQRLLEARATRVRPERDDKVVAAWNGLAITGLCDAGTLLSEPSLVAAAAEAGQLIWDLHVVDGRLRRVSRDGVVGRHDAVLEDFGCVASGFLSLLQATGDAVWLERARVLLDDALARFRADDGGFHDTASDAEELITRPRDISDNASPSGQSAMVHALATYAALTGSGAHRTAAEQTLATLARVAERAPRFAGWVLAAAESMIEGPEEIVVVGRPGSARDALELAARRRHGAVVLAVEPGREDIPLLVGRDEVDGRPAAYVCRNMVCERPVTDPSALDSP
ncbi:thioredoxin domain-containing protein [Nocardioides sp. JQ2195]|uniref:thioredoxin domain-containing protein n=1 Tax=Nocardioides sp. JQ2195 TaxID=2592334 RepID=UPI00143E4D1E|nr:thioredoxin domain-containing protein [Nocardioides sp. JQ2195]QIX27774.1 thioredoxin domain-containing protein [Nocardioides sp. JQ2195]